MEIVTLLAILGGLATVAAAIKAIPIIWGGIKNVGSFLTALENIKSIDDIGEETGRINLRLDELDIMMTQHADDLGKIGNIANEFNASSDNLGDNSIAHAQAVFKSQAVHSETPHFIIEIVSKRDNTLMWANNAWYRIFGIQNSMIIKGHFWETVFQEDTKKIEDALYSASKQPHEFRMRFRVKIDSEEQPKLVTAFFWPLIPVDYSAGDPVSYLGGMDVVDMVAVNLTNI